MEQRFQLIETDVGNEGLRRSKATYLTDWRQLGQPERHRTLRSASDPLSELNRNLMATQELCEIKFLKHEAAFVSKERRRVRAELLVCESLGVSLEFVENVQDATAPATLEDFSVVDGQSLAGVELSPIAKSLANDVPGLFGALKDYALAAADRYDALRLFSGSYDATSSVQPTAEGVVLEWQKLFNLTWSLRWCEFAEKIVNDIEISVNNRETEFIREANGHFRKLSDSSCTREDRQTFLMELGSIASAF